MTTGAQAERNAPLDRRAATRIGFGLHPARLLAALIAATAVLAASTVVAALWPRFGGAAGLLPAMLGGIMALNTLLFFPPGALGTRPWFMPVLLLVNALALPAIILLREADPLLGDAALVAATGVAILARSLPPPAGLVAFLIAINVIVCLVLGAGQLLIGLGLLAAIVGTPIAFGADAIAWLLLRRMGARVEGALLAAAAADFLADLARRWGAATAWPPAWFESHAERYCDIRADLALSRPSSWVAPARLPDLLVESIGRQAQRLHNGRGGLPATVDAAIRQAFARLAEAVEKRSEPNARSAVMALRDAVLGLPQTASNDASAGDVFGLALLLGDFVQASLSPLPQRAQATAKNPKRRIVIAPFQFRLAAQAAICVAAAIAVSHLVPTPKPYWIPLTALLVTCNSFGESVQKALERSLGTIAGLLAGLVAWFLLRGQPPLLLGAIAVSVLGIFCSRAGPYRWMLFWISMALTLILHMADSAPALYFARLGNTLIGAAIALLVTRVVFPARTGGVARARVRDLIALVAGRLREMAAVLERARVESGGPAITETDPADAIAALHALADAEIVEAGLSGVARRRVARRLAAADRIARCLLSLDLLLPELSAAGVGAATVALIRAIADAASGTTPAIDPAAFATREQELLAATGRSSAIIEETRAELHLLRVLAGLAQSVETLRTTDALGDVTAPKPAMARTVPTSATR